MATIEPDTQNPASNSTTTTTSASSPASFTVLITGISSFSPLSTNITSSLITSLLTTRLSPPRDSSHQVQTQAQAIPISISIALLGPDQDFLKETIANLHKTLPQSSHANANANITLHAVPCILTSAQSLGLASHQIRATIGAWDLFIHHPAAHIVEADSSDFLHAPATIRGSDEDTWWNVFELNVHALHHVARHFFSKMKRGAKFVNVLPVPAGITTGTGNSPSVQLYDRGSAEHAAALAAAKVVEYLAAEHATSSGLVCVNVGIGEASSRLSLLPSAEAIVQMALSDKSC